MQDEVVVLPEFPRYAVDRRGTIWNLYRNRPVPVRPNNRGIAIVDLINENHIQSTRSVSLLVAESFVKKPRPIFNAPIHLNGDRMDCSAYNLLWRPRWFAVKYHQQFEDPRFHTDSVPLGVMDSDETYQGWRIPSMRYGLLYTHIIRSYHRGERVFPTGHRFYLLEW